MAYSTQGHCPSGALFRTSIISPERAIACSTSFHTRLEYFPRPSTTNCPLSDSKFYATSHQLLTLSLNIGSLPMAQRKYLLHMFPSLPYPSPSLSVASDVTFCIYSLCFLALSQHIASLPMARRKYLLHLFPSLLYPSRHIASLSIVERWHILRLFPVLLALPHYTTILSIASDVTFSTCSSPSWPFLVTSLASPSLSDGTFCICS
ncbi:uncharacterized protein CC84DRAFT_827437 [Paraphaeosphaeria sporulosa]|uniref:Uncharacterized protein n=1 Tax=Paraphaeosphaeria sporulosa TaxID=1460663 RepID=A0A177CD25_9PLEO|nr:uncharacterized protein CC84DRAFT_827437 [Paraphaeosphaeria sporulosa]OAG05101.1 hypothetical protein CC84DRAFT_827437 [Paraphaeosphaeria sporulosa]